MVHYCSLRDTLEYRPKTVSLLRCFVRIFNTSPTVRDGLPSLSWRRGIQHFCFQSDNLLTPGPRPGFSYATAVIGVSTTSVSLVSETP